MSYLPSGAIDDAGKNPYTIEGNPVIALIAQVNRFVGVTVKGPGCPAGLRPTYPYDTPAYEKAGAPKDSKPFILQPVLTEAAATAVYWTAVARYSCSPSELRSWMKTYTAADAASGRTDTNPDLSKEAWLTQGAKHGIWQFVMANLPWFTSTIAQFADYHGRTPANVGITKTDPRVFDKASSTSLTKAALVLAALGVGLLFVMRKK